MRIRVYVYTAAREIPWEEVHRPGRSLIYSLLTTVDQGFAAHVHAHGWGRRGMAPFGYQPPVFPHAPRRAGVYTAGGPGWLEIGTPLARLGRAVLEGLRDREYLDWGGVALRVTGVHVIPPPAGITRGYVSWRTATPVCLRNTVRGQTVYVLPGERGYEACLAGNLRRKAETLGLPPDLVVCGIPWAGTPRTYLTTRDGGPRTGVRLRVNLRGHPDVLKALWCWGLGHGTGAGFGWVAETTRERPPARAGGHSD